MYWRGKRVKTKQYMDYQHEVRDELNGVEWPHGSSPVSVWFMAGLSARQADLDNLLKPLMDTFQVVFEEFNDNKVYYLEGHKKIVPKGEEFLHVKIERLESEDQLQ